MKVLIEIDKRDYELMKARICKSSSDFIILHGKPLPIGHDDLIDRTELLKAMDTWPKFGLTIDGRFVPCRANVHLVPYVHYADMVQAVKGMPTIIGTDKESESRLIWTPFKERLPKKNQHILVTTFGIVTFGFVTSDPNEKLRLSIIDPINYQMTNADPYTYGIKAWMPLPQPYKAGE